MSGGNLNRIPRVPGRSTGAEIDLDAPARAKHRRGPVTRRLMFIIHHPTLTTYVLLAVILGAYLLTSSWDNQALMLVAGTP